MAGGITAAPRGTSVVSSAGCAGLVSDLHDAAERGAEPSPGRKGQRRGAGVVTATDRQGDGMTAAEGEAQASTTESTAARLVHRCCAGAAMEGPQAPTVDFFVGGGAIGGVGAGSGAGGTTSGTSVLGTGRASVQAGG